MLFTCVARLAIVCRREANIINFHSHRVESGVGRVGSGEGVVYGLNAVRAHFTDFGVSDGGVAELIPGGSGLAIRKAWSISCRPAGSAERRMDLAASSSSLRVSSEGLGCRMSMHILISWIRAGTVVFSFAEYSRTRTVSRKLSGRNIVRRPASKIANSSLAFIPQLCHQRMAAPVR